MPPCEPSGQPGLGSSILPTVRSGPSHPPPPANLETQGLPGTGRKIKTLHGCASLRCFNTGAKKKVWLCAVAQDARRGQQRPQPGRSHVSGRDSLRAGNRHRRTIHVAVRENAFGKRIRSFGEQRPLQNEKIPHLQAKITRTLIMRGPAAAEAQGKVGCQRRGRSRQS